MYGCNIAWNNYGWVRKHLVATELQQGPTCEECSTKADEEMESVALWGIVLLVTYERHHACVLLVAHWMSLGTC